MLNRARDVITVVNRTDCLVNYSLLLTRSSFAVRIYFGNIASVPPLMLKISAFNHVSNYGVPNLCT